MYTGETEDAPGSSSTKSENTTANTSTRRPKPHPKKTRISMTDLENTKKTNHSAGFTAVDVDYLAENEHGRYAYNSTHIGHALISQDKNGNRIAQQYDVPAGNLKTTPIITKLTGIKEIIRNGKRHYQAEDNEGRRFYSKRSQPVLIKKAGIIDETEEMELAFFSEGEDEPEWGSNDMSPLLFNHPKPEIPKKIKGGHKIVVDPESVLYRDMHSDRTIDQNTVMGIATENTSVSDKNAKSSKPSLSAVNAFKALYEKEKDNLTPEIKKIMQRAFEAEIFLTPENQYRPEWLHTYAHSLTHKDDNPQQADNLGAASTYINTEMMVLERAAKWFSINQPSIHISILSAFNMILDSEIIGSIHYELSLELLDRSIQFMLDLNAFREHPLFRKASDVMQTTGVGYAILHNQSPLPLVETITPGISQEEAFKRKIANESQRTPYPSIEETILKTLANKLDAESGNDVVQPHKKLKTRHSGSHLNNGFFTQPTNIPSTSFIATIVDFETSGLSPSKHEIIEIGLITFSFSTDNGIRDVIEHYHSLNEPENPISPLITKLTKIDNEMLTGQKIDWDIVIRSLQRSDFIICHNSKFDRQFFELRTPKHVQEIVRAKAFGCTYQDIDWKARGYQSSKLSFLNEKMGFPFIGHRAINDCWATLNLLLQDPTALQELITNIKKETMLGIINAPFEKKDELKAWGYRWSTGNNTRLAKGWWAAIPNEYVESEKNWLNTEILNSKKNKKAGSAIEEHDAALDRYAPLTLG